MLAPADPGTFANLKAKAAAMSNKPTPPMLQFADRLELRINALVAVDPRAMNPDFRRGWRRAFEEFAADPFSYRLIPPNFDRLRAIRDAAAVCAPLVESEVAADPSKPWTRGEVQLIVLDLAETFQPRPNSPKFVRLTEMGRQYLEAVEAGEGVS
ncbi:MAG: hypothetical protein C0483_14125 [Pirellula sp.]|nr:hypothetical protein [Pirellula sp.]